MGMFFSLMPGYCSLSCRAGPFFIQDFSLKPHIDGLQLATLAFFTIVPFTAATLVPIWRAAITDPEQVMR